MNRFRILLYCVWVMMACTGLAVAAETDVQGSSDHPLVPRLAGFYISGYTQVEMGSRRFTDQNKKIVVVEGRKVDIECTQPRGTLASGELKIRRTLQNDAKRTGGTVLFDDNFNRCTTLLFQKDGREVWVDVRAYDRMYRLSIVEKASGESAELFSPGRTSLVPNPLPQWIKSAQKGVCKGIPQWVAKAGLKDGVVNGPVVTGGYLDGPPLFPMMAAAMVQDGAPEKMVNDLLGPVSEAVTAWAASIRVPGMPWYPCFENIYGSYSIKQYSLQAPLGAMIQSQDMLMPSALSSAICLRIGTGASGAEAKAAIDGFCTWFSNGFKAWITVATIQGVCGEGPIATKYYDPLVGLNSGSVANGTANGGFLSPAPVWAQP
jgi:hypothetical protein